MRGLSVNPTILHLIVALFLLVGAVCLWQRGRRSYPAVVPANAKAGDLIPQPPGRYKPRMATYPVDRAPPIFPLSGGRSQE